MLRMQVSQTRARLTHTLRSAGFVRAWSIAAASNPKYSFRIVVVFMVHLSTEGRRNLSGFAAYRLIRARR